MKLNLNLEVESKLGLIPEPAYHNLSLVVLKSVHVENYEVSLTDTNGNPSTSELAGKNTPRLILSFNNVVLKESTDKNARVLVESFGHVATINKEGIPLEEKIVVDWVSQDFSKLIHIHNVYRKKANTAPMDVAKLNEYNPFAPLDERLAKLKEVFTYIAEQFNTKNETTGKTIYDGVVCCLVVIPGGMNRSQYVLPRYVGKGFLEVFQGLNHKPAIMVPVNVDMNLGKRETNKDAKVNAPKVEDYMKGLGDIEFVE